MFEILTQKTMQTILVVLFFIIIFGCLLTSGGGCGCSAKKGNYKKEDEKKENFEVPKKFINFGNYTFNDHGIGAHTYQTNWSKGEIVNIYKHRDTGLYGDIWLPKCHNTE